MQTALLLEDHAETRQWLAALMRDAFAGIDITEAATLEQARGVLQQQHFNLAIIDINLPDGSGIDLLGEIVQHAPNTYCVIATIFDDDQHIFKALQAGAQGYLLKEQPKAQITQQLQGIINGEPPLSPAIARRVLRYFHDPHTVRHTPGLSERETEVLTLIAKGMSRTEVAKLLGIKVNTAAGYIKNIYQKLDITSRAEATLEATRRGLVKTDI